MSGPLLLRCTGYIRVWSLALGVSAMKRRNFIALLGSATVAWPLAARAQQLDRVQRVGVMLNFGSDDPEAQPLISAFKKGLQDRGWTEDRNIKFDYRWPAADPELMRTYAAELVRATPSAILVNSTPGTSHVNLKFAA